MRRLLLVLAACGLIGTLAADSPKKEPAKSASKLWAVISVAPPVVDWDTWGDMPFGLNFGLVNDSDQPVNPQVEASRVIVNGKDLNVPLGGGPQDDRSKKLPPGDYLSFGKEVKKLFEKPGIYRIVWKGKDFESPEIVFRVMPKPKE